MVKIQGELKEIYSLDVDLSSYRPSVPNNFGFWVRAMIGPINENLSESFDIQICTPNWLKANYSKGDIISGRHMLIVFEYDWKRIKNKIASYCRACSGETWEELGLKLSRLGHWEFEDYQP